VNSGENEMMYRDPYMNDFENRIEHARKRENEMMSFDKLPTEEFRLTAPEGEDSDEDSLGEQTTNQSIEIEIVEDPVDLYGAEYEGYEPYEPNPYDGTYSEM
jgi:hypothetical protein